jgi:hypothetical protein
VQASQKLGDDQPSSYEGGRRTVKVPGLRPHLSSPLQYCRGISRLKVLRRCAVGWKVGNRDDDQPSSYEGGRRTVKVLGLCPHLSSPLQYCRGISRLKVLRRCASRPEIGQMTSLLCGRGTERSRSLSSPLFPSALHYCRGLKF